MLVQDILCSAQHAYQPLQQPSTVFVTKILGSSVYKENFLHTFHNVKGVFYNIS